MNKNEIISKVYHDPAGFGSNAATLADAIKYDNTITLQDVKNYAVRIGHPARYIIFIDKFEYSDDNIVMII